MNYLPWRLTLLGSLRADANGGTVSITRFRSQKTASLLAYLASHPDHNQPREELVERFWPEDDTDAGRNSLRVALAALRREMEPASLIQGSVLATDRFTVRFVSGAVECDVVQFDTALRRANRVGREDPTLRAAALEEAAALYAGPLLPGFYDDWICEERERLQAAFIDTLERLTDYYEARKDLRRALGFAEQLAAAEGAEPADPVYLRVENLRRQAAEAEAREAKSAVQAETRPFLPRPLDALVGREATLRSLIQVLTENSRSARCVTLTGPGGTGKTRLALETASRLQAILGDGNVCFVPLVEVLDPIRVVEAVHGALRLPRTAAAALSEAEAEIVQLNQIRERISEVVGPGGKPKSFLLVLDNFEQIAERGGAGASQVIDRLLRCSDNLLCLITSRRKVGAVGERLFAVPPLAVPDIDGELTPEALQAVPSVALFAERARSVSPDFVLTKSNAAAVAELCARLEGLPLAIELAAAWSASLTPATMLTRLTQRFALLASIRGQDKTDRHRSLWTTIAWSFDLLPEDLRKFWVRLSVFRGGWTAESATALSFSPDQAETRQGVHELLARLRERSLIISLGEDPNGEMRFSLLESLREWASLQLDTNEAIETGSRHAAYFRQVTESARDKLRGPEEKLWLNRFESDHDNFRTACDFYYEQGQVNESEARTGLIFVSTLSLFWRKRGYLREARLRMDQFLELPLAMGAKRERGKVLNSVGLTAWMQNDLNAAAAYYAEGLTIFQSIGDTVGIGKVLSNLSLIAMERNDYPKVIALSEESLVLHRATGDRLSEAMSLGNIGNVYLEQDDYETGRRYHGEALAIYREMGDNEGITIALSGLAYAAVHSGDRDEARRLFHEALVFRQGLNDVWRICFSLTSIADFLLQEGAVPVSAQLYGATEALREEIGAPFTDVRKAEFDGKCREMAAALGQSGFDAAFAEGKRLSRDAAVELALASCLPREKSA